MEIDNIIINKKETEGKIKAYVTFVLNGCFTVHDARIIEGSHGLFVAMPSRKTTNGFKDVCHPITQDLIEKINFTILECYQKSLGRVNVE